MSQLHDVRVYFAAERTQLAWVRTGIAIIALGFVVSRFGLFLQLLSRARNGPDRHSWRALRDAGGGNLVPFSLLISALGVVLASYLTGTELDLSSMIGLTMIIGIVTEVAIFYFAEIDTRVEVTDEAMKHAAGIRLRPIVMTSLIAILALMPLALGIGTGSEMQRPLAITIISGLIFAVPMVLLVMPVLFRTFAGVDQRIRQMNRQVSGGHHPLHTTGVTHGSGSVDCPVWLFRGVPGSVARG